MYEELFEDKATSNCDVFCTISHDYQQYLREIEANESEEQDEFLKMACMFLHMSDDFTLFVQSYL